MNLGFNFEYNNIDPEHAFIGSTGMPRVGIVSYCAQLMANQYLNANHSIKKWRTIKEEVSITYNDGPLKGTTSKPLNYKILSKWIRENGAFLLTELGLMDHHCDWMDGTSEFKLNFHFSDENGEALGFSSGDLQLYYGENYPIKPTLNREGRLYTSYQPQLIQRITKDRTALINSSADCLSDNWIFDLRNLISNVISLVEIALTQLYIKAEYDPLPDWSFSKEKLGLRHGRRMTDKFKWIFQITGRNLNIESEIRSFEKLRELRNHMMHFDPPSLLVTIEEAVIWLNQILDVAMILIKMRLTIGVNISADLINLLLQPEATFVPPNDNLRKPLQADLSENYASSTWPLV